MKIDFMGNELIKYDIVEVLTETACVSNYERLFKKRIKNILVRVRCVVKSEFGVMLEQTTYWEKSEWEKNKRLGFYYAQDESLLDAEESMGIHL